MSDIEDARARSVLDDLLSSWHEWQQRFRPVRSWKSTSLVCGNYQPGRWNDDDNGSLDAELEQRTMEAVDFAVSKLPSAASAAIHQEARNLAAGYQVFISSRLPVEPEQRRQAIAEARRQLIGLLRHAGVM